MKFLEKLLDLLKHEILLQVGLYISPYYKNYVKLVQAYESIQTPFSNFVSSDVRFDYHDYIAEI